MDKTSVCKGYSHLNMSRLTCSVTWEYSYPQTRALIVMFLIWNDRCTPLEFYQGLILKPVVNHGQSSDHRHGIHATSASPPQVSDDFFQLYKTWVTTVSWVTTNPRQTVTLWVSSPSWINNATSKISDFKIRLYSNTVHAFRVSTTDDNAFSLSKTMKYLLLTKSETKIPGHQAIPEAVHDSQRLIMKLGITYVRVSYYVHTC